MIGRTNCLIGGGALKPNASIAQVTVNTFTQGTAVGNYSFNINLSNLVKNDYYLIVYSNGDTTVCVDNFRCTLNHGYGSTGWRISTAYNFHVLIFQPTESSVTVTVSYRRTGGSSQNTSYNIGHIVNS